MPGGVHKEAQEEMGSAGGDGQVRPYHFLTEWLLSGGRCECHVQGTSDCRLLRKMAEDEGQMMLTGPINGNSDVACTRPICVPASPFSFTSFNHRWCTFFFLEATQKFKQTGKRGARASHVSALGPEITERSKPFKNYQRLENHTGSNTHREVPPCRPSQFYFQVFQTRAVADKKTTEREVLAWGSTGGFRVDVFGRQVVRGLGTSEMSCLKEPITLQVLELAMTAVVMGRSLSIQRGHRVIALPSFTVPKSAIDKFPWRRVAGTLCISCTLPCGWGRSCKSARSRLSVTRPDGTGWRPAPFAITDQEVQ